MGVRSKGERVRVIFFFFENLIFILAESTPEDELHYTSLFGTMLVKKNFLKKGGKFAYFLFKKKMKV